MSTKQKYLGVDLSNDKTGVTIPAQFAYTTRANTIIGLLRRDLKSCSPYIKSTVYKTLVRPPSVE